MKTFLGGACLAWCNSFSSLPWWWHRNSHQWTKSLQLSRTVHASRGDNKAWPTYQSWSHHPLHHYCPQILQPLLWDTVHVRRCIHTKAACRHLVKSELFWAAVSDCLAHAVFKTPCCLRGVKLQALWLADLFSSFFSLMLQLLVESVFVWPDWHHLESPQSSCVLFFFLWWRALLSIVHLRCIIYQAKTELFLQWQCNSLFID